jgi:membrane fusion protein, multidrug efflux system
MRMVRVAVLASVIVVCGAAFVYRTEIERKLGFAPASAADSSQPAGRRPGRPAAGPVPVVVVTVSAKSMPVIVEAVGTVQAVSSIPLKSRIDSQIMKVHVQEGALVKEGDLLFELDARTLKAQLGVIEAQIRKDQAQIAQAKRDSARADDLLTKGAGTIVSRDTNATSLKALEAQLESDQASRDSTLAQITYTEIRAPVSGRIGSIPNKAGTIVRIADNTATSVLATINQVDPIFVQFAIPQIILPGLRAAMAKGDVKVDAVTDDGTRQAGVMAFIENTVDPLTGTVSVKARIANANEGLWPGQFVKAEVVLGVEADALAIPAAAIQLGAQGPYVFVIKDGKTAEVRPITIKRTQAGQSVVGSGLQPGDSVVIDGQLRLVNGAPAVAKQAPVEAPKPTPPRG